MRNKIFIFLLLFLITILFLFYSCNNNTNKNKQTYNEKAEYADFLIIDSAQFNIGNIYEKCGKVSHIFNIFNSSNDTITINRITQGCSCVSAKVNSHIIFPKDSIKLNITFDPTNKKGYFNKHIFIQLNQGDFFIMPGISGVVN
jgi:hypothetical protein